VATSGSWLSHERYPRLLVTLLAAVSALLAIAPHDRADWALENSLLVVGVVVLVATHRALPLSRVSYTLIFLFLCLHAVGAHYTYSLVPYDPWIESLTGRPDARSRA
jgi:putative membrane protein